MNTTSGSGLDYYYKKKLLIWSDLETRKVYVLNDKNHSVDINGGQAWQPVAVAVDWIGENLYVADNIGQKIDLFDLSGTHQAIVLGHNLTAPSDIALDPTRGYESLALNAMTEVISRIFLFLDLCSSPTRLVSSAHRWAARNCFCL